MKVEPYVPEIMSDEDKARFNKLVDTFGEEDLDPELAACVTEGGPLGPCIQHPLVYSIMHFPAQNKLVNRKLKAKKEALKKAVAEKNWNTVVYLHERPYRLDAFMAHSWAMKNTDYWETLGAIWIDSENMHQNRDEWRECLLSGRAQRNHIMSKEDRAFLNRLRRATAPVEVYRGICYEDATDGLSWTLDRERAVWFARRFAREDMNDKPVVLEGVIDRKLIVAYMSGRGEEEVILFPEDVQNMKAVKI